MNIAAQELAWQRKQHIPQIKAAIERGDMEHIKAVVERMEIMIARTLEQVGEPVDA